MGRPLKKWAPQIRFLTPLSAEAESGVKNIIWGAHNCRGLPIKLARPATNDDGEVILEDNDDDGSAIEEDDIEGIEINEDADEDNNPPQFIV